MRDAQPELVARATIRVRFAGLDVDLPAEMHIPALMPLPTDLRSKLGRALLQGDPPTIYIGLHPDMKAEILAHLRVAHAKEAAGD